MKQVILSHISVCAGYINAIYTNKNGEDINCRIRLLGDLEIWWRNMDTEIRRQLNDRLAPGYIDGVDEFYKETEKAE